MNRKFIRRFFLFLATLLLTLWHVAYDHSNNGGSAGEHAIQLELAGPSITSGLANTQETSGCNNSPVLKIRGYAESDPDEGLHFRLYVTPYDPAIAALANQINGARDAYEIAVQWTYVSERKLNHVADKWLTPHEFLTNTPHYPSNPLKDEEVSDCEEQTNTLISLIRAGGIQPESVRVALGAVRFSDEETGHAWVELLTSGRWVAIDPSSGPYWDDEAGKLVRRRGRPFNFYSTHTYPVLQVWAYYNDIHYLTPGDGSGNAPPSWSKTAPAR